MENKNIHIFKTKSNNQYIYDACTNRVFQAPDPIPEIIDQFKFKRKEIIIKDLQTKYPTKSILPLYSEVNKWINIDNAFFSFNNEDLEFKWTKTNIKDRLSLTNLPKITLIVTEDCNFRCKYCSYSGNYKYQRNHLKNYMTFDIAKKSIDYFLSQRLSKDFILYSPYRIAIGFYGGEPLLNFKLIKNVVEYTKSTYSDLPFHFTITTNGTLLTKSICKFLIENDFGTMISLDGPQEEHDRNRVFKNGQKTHDVITTNIKMLSNYDKKYFIENVKFSCCYDYKSNIRKIINYFIKNKYNVTNFARINSVDTNYYNKFNKKDRSKYNKNRDYYKNMYEKYILDNFDCKEICNKIIYSFNNFEFEEYCEHRQSNRTSSYTGTCIPGDKIAVSPNGTFHVCEKINSYFPIGNYKTGLDYARINKIMNLYFKQVIIENKCNICIARHHCAICLANCSQNKCFNSHLQCSSIKINFIKKLEDFYTIFEKNPLVYLNQFESNTLLEL